MKGIQLKKLLLAVMVFGLLAGCATQPLTTAQTKRIERNIIRHDLPLSPAD